MGSRAPRTLPGERVVLHVSYTRMMMRPMESYPPEIEEQLIGDHGEGMAQLFGRNDFLAKSAGKNDVQLLYNSIVNGRS